MKVDEIPKFQSLLEDITSRQHLKECLRFGTIRLGLDILTFPFHQLQLLRQVQSFEIVNDIKDTSSFESIKSFDIDEWNQEQNLKIERDRQKMKGLYMIQDEDADKSISKFDIDSKGYPIVQTNNLSKCPICLPKNASMIHNISLLTQKNGIFSLWNGLIPRWIYKCCVEMCHYYFSPLKSLIFDILFGIPLEVLECKMIVQSVYPAERISIIKEIIKWEGLKGFYPNIGLALLQKSIIPILNLWTCSFLYTSEDLVFIERSYLGWLWNCVLKGISHVSSLAISIPLQNIRRRMILSNIDSYPLESQLITRIPIKRYFQVWECCQAGNLYEGIEMELFGILSNTILEVLANIETELPNYTIDL